MQPYISSNNLPIIPYIDAYIPGPVRTHCMRLLPYIRPFPTSASYLIQRMFFRSNTALCYISLHLNKQPADNPIYRCLYPRTRKDALHASVTIHTSVSNISILSYPTNVFSVKYGPLLYIPTSQQTTCR
jgi:hypothetical protein